jgi:YD repeat-containing protein
MSAGARLTDTIFVRFPFCVVVSIVAATNAYADSRCLEAMKLRGAVTAVVVREGTVDLATGAVRGSTQIRHRWTISDDRRTVATVEGPSATQCEFDTAGLLRRSVLKLDGINPFTTVEYTYDGEGRQTLVRSRSANPQFNYDHTYVYIGDTVHATYAAGITEVTTTYRDSSGRVSRELKRRPDGHPEGTRLDYEYGPETVKIRGRENGRDWVITRTLDPMGNTIEGTSTPLGSRQTLKYTYDSDGNWIERITAWASTTQPDPTRGGLEIRDITYTR